MKGQKPVKPTRRKVLAVALTAGAGVATSRLLGLKDLDARALAASQGRDASRTDMGMGMSLPEMDDVAAPDPLELAGPPPAGTPAPPPSTTLAPAVAPQTTPAAPAPAAARAVTTLDWVAPLDSQAGRIGQLLRRTTFGPTVAEYDRAQSEGYARTLERILGETPAPPKALTDTEGRNLGTLQSWWLDHMVTSPTPFAELMTLFWHGHFTSDYRKVGMDQPYLYWQNLTWRGFSQTDLRTVLKQVTVDPAMLKFLDLGISTGRSPNENYSRELMELFTMGVGTFTEADVQAGAKALAGWRVPRATEGRSGIFDRNRAFVGQVTFLGKAGAFDADGVVDQILAQPSTAPHFVRALLAEFVRPDPSAAYVDRLAARFRAVKFDVKSLLRDIFNSPEFFHADSYRSLVKSPTHLAISLARVTGSATLARTIAGAGTTMGQALFDPPSVGGWPDNVGWVSSNSVVARTNFVAQALSQVKDLPPTTNAHLRILDGVLAPQTVKLLNATGDERARWTILLSSPEFQLK